VLTAFNIALEGKDCWVPNSDARVRATASTYVYPDVSVVCGKPEVRERDILLNPVVIVEVLSESTERYDRGLKFSRYRRMESLQEYVLVAQSDPRIEVFRRQTDGSWSLRIYEGLETSAKLESIGVDISLHTLYQGIEFTATETA
jgi:Uma2 family endonuclease